MGFGTLYFYIFVVLILADTVVEQRICSQYKEDQIIPAKCPSDHECSKLGAECMECKCSSDCKYGKSANASCTVPESGPNAINVRKQKYLWYLVQIFW